MSTIADESTRIAGIAPGTRIRMLRNPRFHTTRGECTAYALACGYSDDHTGDRHHVSLWREHGTYHVRVNDADTRAIVSWETYDTAKAARAAFRVAARIA